MLAPSATPLPRVRSWVAWLSLAVLLAHLAVSCTKVPITGRRQLNMVPDAIMLPLGASTYDSMLSSLRVAQRGEQNALIQRVGQRLARAVESDPYEWEYALVRDDDTVNAWALPGGKLAIYSGILPVCRNEAGLAFIMAHETGHVLARHGSERISHQLAVLGGLAGLYLYLDNKTQLDTEQQAIILAAVGLGAEVGLVLPFSRQHEREADVIGLLTMARAGYPPEEGLAIWERMEQAEAGSVLPEFLSTHPSHDSRERNLEGWLDKAERRYERNKLARDTTAVLWE